MKSRGTLFLLSAGIAMLTLSAGSANAVVIYSDDFSGSGDLNGQAPDTALGGQTWIASTTAPAWQADGAIAGAGHRNAWLPFTPLPGNVYTLSLDVNPNSAVSNTTDWFALGLGSTPGVTNDFQSNGTAAWMLNRVRRTNSDDVQTFLGPGTGGGASHPSTTGTVNLEVVLDTQAPNWTAEWFFEGTAIRGPVAYAANPPIKYVGFAKYGDAQGFVDNFELSALYDQRAVTDLFNTGVDAAGNALGDGVDDPHYALIAQPAPGGLTDVTVNDTWPIAPAGPWVANGPNSRWIGPDANQGNGPGGDYIYRTTFTLPDIADLNAVALNGLWGSDNGGFDILINGASTGQANSGFGTLVPFSITDGFVFGTNTLDFALNNAGGGPSALRVDAINAMYLVPEPATLALLGLGALALRRRKR